MTTTEIAKKLVGYCSQGKGIECQDELFANNVKSIEAKPMFGPILVEGKANVKAKALKFIDGVQEFHGMAVSDPIVAGDAFAVTMSFDFTPKGGQRMKLEEVCAYQVEDGKITVEQFF